LSHILALALASIRSSPRKVGPNGEVVGVEMPQRRSTNPRPLPRSSAIEFHYGLAEAMPIEDGWADAVISNGVMNPVRRQTRSLR
jgi:hypothetical protein